MKWVFRNPGHSCGWHKQDSGPLREKTNRLWAERNKQFTSDKETIAMKPSVQVELVGRLPRKANAHTPEALLHPM